MKVIFYALIMTLAACKPEAQSLSDNVNPETVELIDQAIASSINSKKDEAKITITFQPDSLMELITNAQTYLELQDYIVRRFESENPNLSENLKLGVDVKLAQDTVAKNLRSTIATYLSGIQNLTANVDFVKASSPKDLNSPMGTLLDNLGIKRTDSVERILTGKNITKAKCHAHISELKTHEQKHLTISLPNSKVGNFGQRNIQNCVNLASKNGLGVNILVKTLLSGTP